MRSILTISLLVFGMGATLAQTSISLDSCISWAKANYPMIQQNGYLAQQSQLNQNGISEAWLPKISFVGQATYNTEVVAFNFPGMDVKFPHDAYMTALNLEQILLDGGQTKAQHSIESINSEVEIQKNEIELYRLVERINQIYVNILLGRENQKILTLYKEDLTNRFKNMKVAVENQLVLQSALDELEAEILKTDQNLIETRYNLSALYKTLNLYIQKDVNESTVFSDVPIGGRMPITEVARPELKLFDLQAKLLDARFTQTNSFAMPKITVGATANYGRPGPNFINQELRFFGSANLTVRWNVSSLYGLKRERQKLEFSKSMVELQRETFLFNLESSLSTQTAQMNAINEQITMDDQIISKRHSVTETATSQMENGKITVANYLTQLNAELQAQLTKKVHEIKRMNAISMINATSGSIKF